MLQSTSLKCPKFSSRLVSFTHAKNLWGWTTLAILAALGLRLAGAGAAANSTPINLNALNSAYTQDFDSLANTGTSSATPAGWGFAESGTNANATYTAGTGSGNAGDTYSFGASGSTERAFGGLQSGSLIPTIGACFNNNTGTALTSLVIGYTGEEWRLGATGRADRLDFQYSLDATSLTTGNWMDVNELDFSTPNTGASTGAQDGNASANRTALSFTITGLNIPQGATFFIRWTDFNVSGSDDGLAVDNFSLTPQGAGGGGGTLSLACTPASFAENAGANASLCTATRTGSTAAALTVNLLSSDVTEATVPASVNIPINATQASFAVAAVDDLDVDGTQTVTLTASATGFISGTTTLMVTDNDLLSNTLIHDIQGGSETPNFVGQTRQIQGIVVGDFQGSATGLGGFFVEEEQSDWDADPNTSEGIFVFEGANSTPVNVGDKVTVIGTVINFGGATGLTELSPVTSVSVNSTGNPLPPVQNAALPVALSPAAELERFEGMLVQFTQTLFVTDNSNLGSFGELGLSAHSPLYIPTNSVDPNDDPATGNNISGNSNVPAVTARQTLNHNSRIILDDGRSGSNPNPIPFIGAGTNSTIRRGDSIANLAGVLSYGFGSYRIEPTALPLSFNALNPRTTAPGAVGASTLRVASFNVENYFATTGTGRGPDNANELLRKRAKVTAALAGLNADVIGLIELEKGTQANPNAAISDIVTALNGQGIGTYAFVATPAAVYDPTNPVGTDTEIKSGIIYRTSAVAPVGSSFTDTAAAPGAYSRAPIAQTFLQLSNDQRFTLVVNHFRSKSCPGSGGDADQGDGQACFNARRRSQAQAVVAFVNTTIVPLDPDVLIVGDLNAYGQEDPIDVFRGAGLSDALGQHVAASSQYSFTFNGEAGRLDHAFATGTLNGQITGAGIWHINADEPSVFDYNEGKPDDRFAPTPFRSADHDPVLLGLQLACPVITVTAPTTNIATAGVPFSVTFTQTGGGGATTFSAASALPNGLTLSAAGVLSGTPTQTGTFTLTVRATDASGCTGMVDYTLTINCPTITINPATLPAAAKGAPYSQTFTATNSSGATAFSLSVSGTVPPGLSFAPNPFTTNFTLSGTPTQAGNFTFTVKVTDANGCLATQTYTLPVHQTGAGIADPLVCLGPGGLVDVTATVTNSAATPQLANFAAPLPASLRALAGRCTATAGACAVDVANNQINWTGTLAAGQTVAINYQAQVADGTPSGTQICVTSTVTVGNASSVSVTACTRVTCPPVGPGQAYPAASAISDQKAGSVLIYNLYSSSASNANLQNTRISLTNVEAARSAFVHLFFVDGATCSVADSVICLTPNQTTSFLASDVDPGTTGYLVAVAIDQNGCPLNFNQLIGDAYVKLSSGHAANLAAEAIAAIPGSLAACNANSPTAELRFDGVMYNALPWVLALSNLASAADGNSTLLVVNRIGGNLSTGAATLTGLFGIVYDDAENPFSFGFSPGACQFRSVLGGGFPRTTPRLEVLLPAGRSGWLKLGMQSEGAIMGATINLNANAGAAANAFNQGHNLHKLTLTTAASVTIPVFPPTC